jgi:hypothetical protein
MGNSVTKWGFLIKPEAGVILAPGDLSQMDDR